MTGRVRSSLAVLALWTALALLFTPQGYLLNQRGPGSPTWYQTALNQLPMFWGWALLTPFVLWCGRRLPLEPPHRARNIALSVLVGFAFAFVHLYIALGAHWLIGWIAWGEPRVIPLQRIAIGYGATNVMICWGILAASQALTWFRRYEAHERRLVEAQLHSLKTQLHPHFLFNTLNGIAELLHADPHRAERTVTTLSDLLRMALGAGSRELVPLEHEIEFSRAYTSLQQTLLEDRLTVRWQIDDDVLDAEVPAMLLQPLVENAVRHGISPRLSGGTVAIAARRTGDRLVVSVEDDGVGLTAAKSDGGGVGISNTRARLAHLYGAEASLTLTPRGDDGTAAIVDLPFRRARLDAQPA